MKTSLLVIAGMLIFGCSQTSNSSNKDVEEKSNEVVITNEVLMAEVMELHDAVMPEMGNIRKTRKALLEKLEVTTDEELQGTYDTQAQKMDSAFQSMMEWMRGFDPEYAGTEEEVKNYLLTQKEKMENVKELMESSLNGGLELLDEPQD